MTGLADPLGSSLQQTGCDKNRLIREQNEVCKWFLKFVIDDESLKSKTVSSVILKSMYSYLQNDTIVTVGAFYVIFPKFLEVKNWNIMPGN